MKLQNGHIIIPAKIFETILDEDEQVNLVYYPDRQQLLLAGKSKTFFEKMHKTKWVRLKDKNMKGDKSLYIREVLLDYDLDDTDRELTYDTKNTGIIAVFI